MATTTGKPTAPLKTSTHADTADTARDTHGAKGSEDANAKTDTAGNSEPTTDAKGHHFDPISEATPSAADSSEPAPVKPIDKPVSAPVTASAPAQVLPNEDPAKDTPIRPTIDDGTATEGHRAEDISEEDQTPPDNPDHADRPAPFGANPSAVTRIDPAHNPHEDR